MKPINRLQLESSLHTGKVSSLYLLLGPETFLSNAAAESISDAALRETLLREFNQTSFNLLGQAAKDVVAVADQLPMMSNRRVVRVTNFGKLRESDETVLDTYVKRPNESTVMIFVAAELDKRRKLSKSLLDTCLVVEFPGLSLGEAKGWVRDRLKQLKVKIDEDALSALVDMVGTDVQSLHSELDKLAAAVVTTGRITHETVDSLTSRTRELSNFELGDQILSRNRQRALETLHRLLDGGTPPVMLIGLIASNYHKLAIAKDTLARGGRDEVFKAVPVPGWKRNEFISTLQKTDSMRITKGIQLIAAADLAIKTSQATPRLQLEMLVCELAH